jgi:hypothetical protein
MARENYGSPLHAGDDTPEWNEETYGRRWGIVVFPELNDPELWDEKLGWAVFRGWYSYDPATGSHIVSPAVPIPGVLEGTISFTDLSVAERRQMYLAFPSPQEHTGSREHLAEMIYWDATMSSEGRIPWDFELFRSLLTDWVGTMQRRGLDPEKEMQRLLDAAITEVSTRRTGDQDADPNR